MVQNMLVGLDGSAYCEAAAELGVRWAQRAGAPLTGLAVVDEPTIRRRELSFLGERYTTVLREEARLRDARRRAEQALKDFARRCAEAAVGGRVLCKVGPAAEEILFEAADYDLTLLGRRTYFHFETGDDDETLDAVLRRSRRPVVAVPRELPESPVVVVGYDASRPAVRALESLQRAKVFEGRPVHVISVDPRAAIAARRAEEGAKFLRCHGFPAEARPFATSRQAGEVLLERVRELKAGTLVMGAYGRSALREAFFGSTTRTVVEQGESVLFLHH